MAKSIFSALAIVATFGVVTMAQAQTTVDCPQTVIDDLEEQFPGEGRGTNAGDCQAWKHGIGDASTNRNWARGGNSPLCGFPNNPTPIFGQMIIIEPNDSVCDPFDAGVARCPFVLGGDGATDDSANRSYWESPALIETPIFRFLSQQVISVEGVSGYRIDCGQATLNDTIDNGFGGASADDAECGAGQTALFLDDGFQDGDAGVDPGADWRHQQNLFGDANTEGNSICCDSVDDVFCQQAANFDEYPILTRPLPDVFLNRPQTPPWIFTGGRGTGWSHSLSFAIDGQQYGYCETNIDVECNLTGGDCTDGDTLCSTNQCPALGDVCNLREEAIRAGTSDFEADGSPNPGRCRHNRVRMIGAPVDPVTGLSTGCALGTFFAAGTEGDPQPGCQVPNFGGYTRPDLDCDGVEDDTDGDGQPGPDLCPAIAEENPFDDSNLDGIGDDCQCGDINGDGAVTGIDIGGAAICANDGTQCDATKSDADGDLSVTAQDIAGIVIVVNGNAQTSDLTCLRKP